MIKCCGTCYRFELNSRRPGKGKCLINGKEYKANDMKGCLAWKIAKTDELVKRRKELDSQLFDEDMKSEKIIGNNSTITIGNNNVKCNP